MKMYRVFPSGAMDRNQPANAGDTGLDPWSRKIPHASEQLSPWATTTEPILWGLRAVTTEPVCCNY